ncbi:MAG: hypothetical protein ABIV43_02875 [Candidatus Saccharimonadales bacterium]
MTSKLDKALDKLSPDERSMTLEIIRQLMSGDLSGLQIKKLSGHSDIYRVRKGRIRIIFRQTVNGTMIIAVDKR